jgi:ribosomal protein S27AE
MANILGNQPKIDLSVSTPVVCAHCGYDVFIAGTKMRKVSKLAAGTDQDVIVPFEIMVCGECGSVLEELLPQQILALEKLDKLKVVKTNVANDKLII